MISENLLIINGFKRIHHFNGNSSVVNIYELGNKAYAVKKPKNEQMAHLWRISAKKSYDMRKILDNLSTPVQTSEIESFHNDTLIEQYLPGQRLNDPLYASLPESEQNQIAYDIAVFLNELHQYHMDVIENKAPVNPEPLGYGTSAVIKQAVGEKNWNLFQSNLQHIRNTQHLGKHICYTHQDLRPDNVLYDTETKTVKIIDFGEADKDKDIYYDFAPTISKPGLLPWKLTEKTVQVYNTLDKKIPVHIEIDLVRDLQIQQILKLFETKIFNLKLQLPQVSYTALGTSFDTYKGNVRIGSIPELTTKQASEFYENEFKPLIDERLFGHADLHKKHNLLPNILRRYKSNTQTRG